jgi:hypothetical protein
MPQHGTFAANRHAPANAAPGARREQQRSVIGDGVDFEDSPAHRLLHRRLVRASIPIADWARVSGLDALQMREATRLCRRPRLPGVWGAP